MMQAIALMSTRAKTIKSFTVSRRSARRRALSALSSAIARNVPSPIKETQQLSGCSVSDKRNPAIVGVNLNAASGRRDCSDAAGSLAAIFRHEVQQQKCGALGVDRHWFQRGRRRNLDCRPFSDNIGRTRRDGTAGPRGNRHRCNAEAQPFRNCRHAILLFLIEIAPEPTGLGLPLDKCEAYNRVYDQPYEAR